MPKKQRNAFYFFMKEYQDKYNRLGKRVSMKELVEECHPLYKDLSATEKEKYEQAAKDFKCSKRDTVDGKLCSDGTVLARNMQAEKEKCEILENEIRAVDRMISEISNLDAVADKAFYVACFNVLCCTDEEEYIPNEVGIVKYSIRRGIEESFHSFIDPGAIPLGYTHASKQHSDDTHKIPISGFEQADKNYSKISKDILELVNPERNRIAAVFCTEENLEQNRGCVDWLFHRTGNLLNTINFYDLTFLLMELRARAGEAFPTRAVALDFLSNHAFDYTANTRCDYHEDLDNRFCAMGCAKRLCFILSDALCSLYNVDCTPNHLPPRVGEEFEVEVQQPVIPPSRTFIHSVFSQQNYVSRCSPANNKTEINAQSWSNEFYQPQLNIASLNKSSPSSSSIGKPSAIEEMRQPSTKPLVLNAPPINPAFALLGRGKGIGRGRQPQAN